jgi:glutamine amidotransferase
MIAIIDYGMGNLRSVVKGFERVGVKVFLTGDPVLLEQAGGVVLPGVGAFADAMVNLRTTGMDLAVHRAVQAGKLFLGICLGQQLLFEFSEEWGLTKGLGIFPGGVKRLPPALKVPHMGWNQIEIQRPDPLLQGVPDLSSFYFVHYHDGAGANPGNTASVKIQRNVYFSLFCLAADYTRTCFRHFYHLLN